MFKGCGQQYLSPYANSSIEVVHVMIHLLFLEEGFGKVRKMR